MPARPGVDASARVLLSEHLQNVTEALAAARTQAEVFGVVLEPALTALGAVAGAVLLVGESGDRLELAATRGHEAGAQTLWQDGPLDGNVPAGDALERHEALFFEHQGDLTRAYPELEARTGGVAAVATAVLPLFLDERPLGTLILDFREPHDFTPEEKRFLRTLASQCALALGRARSLAGLQAELGRRRQTEHGLRASEARFRRMVEASPVAIAAGDPSGRLILVNDAYLGLLGLTRAEFGAGQIDWASLTPPEYREADERAFAQAIAGGASEPYEKEMLTREGERVPLNVVLIRYEDGERSLVVGYLQDLSAQRAAEAVLRAHSSELEAQVRERTRESEAARVRAEVLASLGDALQRASTPGEVADLALDTLGPALGAQSMLVVRLDGEGIRLPTLWGNTPEVITSYMTRPGLRLEDTPILRRVAGTGQGLYLDDYRAEPGAVASFPALAGGVEPIRLPDGSLGGFLVVWRGTDRGPWQGAERDLLFRAAGTLGLALERAEQARRVAEQNAELDARTRALEGFAELTRDLTLQSEPGRLTEQALGMVLSLLPAGVGLFYERHGPRWRVAAQVGDLGSPALQAAVEAGLPVGETPTLDRPYETRAPFFQDVYDPALDVSPDLVRHLHTVSTLPVLVNGEVVGIFNVVLFEPRPWGVADRAVLETTVRSLGLALEGAQGMAHLAEERRKLQAANEELEAFTYSVSHDLRTPVRHIGSFNVLLRRQLGDGLDAKAARYLGIVDEATGRMNTLIDAMLDLSRTSRLPLQMGLVDLDDLVRTVRAELEAEVPERAVDWCVAPLPLVTGDPHTLRQVVVNLLSNALKYTRPREETRVEVWAEERPDEWAVLVRDNGVGFDPRYADKLFGVFQRLHRHDEFEGTGVGLANVRRIVARHGGRVWAEGRPGEGATFGFSLPRP